MPLYFTFHRGGIWGKVVRRLGQDHCAKWWIWHQKCLICYYYLLFITQHTFSSPWLFFSSVRFKKMEHGVFVKIWRRLFLYCYFKSYWRGNSNMEIWIGPSTNLLNLGIFGFWKCIWNTDKQPLLCGYICLWVFQNPEVLCISQATLTSHLFQRAYGFSQVPTIYHSEATNWNTLFRI